MYKPNKIVPFTSRCRNKLAKLSAVYPDLPKRLNVSPSTIESWLHKIKPHKIYSDNANAINNLYRETFVKSKNIIDPEPIKPIIEPDKPIESEPNNINDPELSIADLLPIREQSGIETVNGRDLHEWLEVGRDFSTWIKDRISKFEFIEGTDFLKLTKSGELSITGQTSIEYHISTDMAKELSMVENNVKGRDARRYFIKVEKLARQHAKQIPPNQSPHLEQNSSMVQIQPEQFQQLLDMLDGQVKRTDKLYSHIIYMQQPKRRRKRFNPDDDQPDLPGGAS